ncbi:MAG: hydrogenase iron-sulfur subunit [Bacillota bacterium]
MPAPAAAGPAGTGPEQAQARFEPKIVAFCCYYCAYSAADLAGSMRLQYPPNVRLIEVPCSGRVDPALLLRALEEGADGVYVAGCMEGDCHFQQGNIRAKRRVGAIKKLLSQIGWEPERVEMYNVPASDGARFAQVAREFTERVRQLGPNPARAKKVRA